MAMRITAYGNRARTAGNGNIGAIDPADAMQTLMKSSSFRTNFAPYLIPWYVQKNLCVYWCVREKKKRDEGRLLS